MTFHHACGFACDSWLSGPDGATRSARSHFPSGPPGGAGRSGLGTSAGTAYSVLMAQSMPSRPEVGGEASLLNGQTGRTERSDGALGVQVQEQVHDVGIELLTTAGPQFAPRPVLVQRCLMWTIRPHRGPGHAHGQDPRFGP